MGTMFDNWRVSRCCCFSLRTGNLILAYFSAIVTGFCLLLALGVFATTNLIVDEVIMQMNKTNENEINPNIEKEAVFTVRFFVGIILCWITAHFILAILLLRGIYKEQDKYILINVVLGGYEIALTILMGIVKFFTYLISGYFLSAFIGIMFELVPTLLSIYFLIVMNSYRLELLENVKRRFNAHEEL